MTGSTKRSAKVIGRAFDNIKIICYNYYRKLKEVRTIAKGAIVKEELINKILANIEDSFVYNGGKEIRVNMIENGEPVQLKLAITAAKVAVSPDDEGAVPGAKPKNTLNIAEGAGPSFESTDQPPLEATEQEKENIASLMASLGL